TGTAGKYHDPAFFQMAESTAPDERLGHLVHLDSGHHPRVHALFFQRILEGKRVNDRRQHAHMVGGYAVHLPRLLGHTTKEVPAAHHQSDLHTKRVDIANLAGDSVDSVGLHSKAFVAGQSLAGKFEQDAFESKHGWSQYSSQVAEIG